MSLYWRGAAMRLIRKIHLSATSSIFFLVVILLLNVMPLSRHEHLIHLLKKIILVFLGHYELFNASDVLGSAENVAQKDAQVLFVPFRFVCLLFVGCTVADRREAKERRGAKAHVLI